MRKSYYIYITYCSGEWTTYVYELPPWRALRKGETWIPGHEHYSSQFFGYGETWIPGHEHYSSQFCGYGPPHVLG